MPPVPNPSHQRRGHVMSSASTLFSTLHAVALAAFVAVTAVSMGGALLSRLRLRDPLLVWRRPGPLTRWPLGPSLFLLVVALGLGHAAVTGRAVSAPVLLGYPAGGLFWLGATWLARTVAVTEQGLVHDITRPHRAVPWRRVADYVATTRNGQPHLVLLYRDADDRPQRLDLSVPTAHASALQEVLERKLDARFRDDALRPHDEMPLDRPDESSQGGIGERN